MAGAHLGSLRFYPNVKMISLSLSVFVGEFPAGGVRSARMVAAWPSAAGLKRTQVQSLCRSGGELQGADSGVYLPISPWILLQYWQTDSPALWGGGQIPSISRLSFPIKPFHLNVQSTPPQQKINKITRMRR